MSVDSIEASEKKYLFLGAICWIVSIFAYWWVIDIQIDFVLLMFFWVIAFLMPFVFVFVPPLLRLSSNNALKNWQGIHYLFNRARVRVLYSSGLVWLATEDVLVALELPRDKDHMYRLLMGKQHQIIPGTQVIGISEEHLRDFVLGTNAEAAQHFVLWFERQILRPIKNKVDQGFYVPEAVDNYSQKNNK